LRTVEAQQRSLRWGNTIRPGTDSSAGQGEVDGGLSRAEPTISPEHRFWPNWPWSYVIESVMAFISKS